MQGRNVKANGNHEKTIQDVNYFFSKSIRERVLKGLKKVEGLMYGWKYGKQTDSNMVEPM